MTNKPSWFAKPHDEAPSAPGPAPKTVGEHTWEDRFRGAVLGGAVGDVLGAPVRTRKTADIQQWFAARGVVDYLPLFGRRGAGTDLTQLTAFTLEALLRAKALNPDSAGWLPTQVVGANHLRWLYTQGVPWQYAMSAHLGSYPEPDGWLLERPELFSTRNPTGAALRGFGELALATTSDAARPPLARTSVTDPIVWAAPTMVWNSSEELVFAAGASIAGLLTEDSDVQGAAGLHCDVLAQVIRGAALWDAVSASDNQRLGRAHYTTETPAGVRRMIHAAMFASAGGRRPGPSELDIEFDTDGKPGELGIALASVAATDSFASAVRMAVNQSADSCVTGALAGQLAGALYGPEAIPLHWVEELELGEILETLCADASEAFAPPPVPKWAQRYVAEPKRAFSGPLQLPTSEGEIEDGRRRYSVVSERVHRDGELSLPEALESSPADAAVPPSMDEFGGASSWQREEYAEVGSAAEPEEAALVAEHADEDVPSSPFADYFGAAYESPDRDSNRGDSNRGDSNRGDSNRGDSSQNDSYAVPSQGDSGYGGSGYAGPRRAGAVHEESRYKLAAYVDAPYMEAAYMDAGSRPSGHNELGHTQSGANEAGSNETGYDETGRNEAGYSETGYSEVGRDSGVYEIPFYESAHDAPGESAVPASSSYESPAYEGPSRYEIESSGYESGEAYAESAAEPDDRSDHGRDGYESDDDELVYDGPAYDDPAEDEPESGSRRRAGAPLDDLASEYPLPQYVESSQHLEGSQHLESSQQSVREPEPSRADSGGSTPRPAGGHAKVEGPDPVAPSLTERVLGSLLGGALGNALGADLETATAEQISERFGPQGPQALSNLERLNEVGGAVTGDTQMMLFTAEGLIRGSTASRMLGSDDPLPEVQLAYQRWLHTRGVAWQLAAGAFHSDHPVPDGWLVSAPGMFDPPFPDNTVFESLVRFGQGRPTGSVIRKINDSKGSGGLTRAAPAALYSSDPSEVFELAVRTAALTHGHPSGYLSAGALAVIVQQALLGRTLDDGVWLALQVLETWDGHEETSALLKAGVELAGQGMPAPQQIERTLGAGWVGEQALAIAVCAALVAEDDFVLAVRVAVHHSGDSDSTGAVCGNIMGALLGVEVLPVDWLSELKLRDVIQQVALDCVAEFGDSGFGMGGDQDAGPSTDDDWTNRYPVRESAGHQSARATEREPEPIPAVAGASDANESEWGPETVIVEPSGGPVGGEADRSLPDPTGEIRAPKPAPRRINGMAGRGEG